MLCSTVLYQTRMYIEVMPVHSARKLRANWHGRSGA